jgi:rhamnosyltransferase
VVTYHPNRDFLNPLLDQLCLQCQEVLIVDNSPAGDDSTFEIAAETRRRFDNLRQVRVGMNAGIASALNIGIDVALAEDFEYVLLSDQDSLPSTGMVAGLVQAGREMAARGKPVGAIGPLIRDLVTKMDYPFQAPIAGKLFYGHRFPTPHDPHVIAISIITSGTLISAAAARDIGRMAEDLFIDYVDVEWCHRARAKGYEVVGTGNAVLCHRLGDQGLRVWYRGWKLISEYGPLRLYYRMRNFIHLLRAAYVPRSWKVRSCWYMLGIVYGHVVYSNRRLASFTAVMSGLWDGILGRLGPCRRHW